VTETDVHTLTTHLREGLVATLPEITLQGAVDIDEVYVVAGHKGHPAAG
jgi:hypothetical protein